MKINGSFVMREVVGEYLLIPVGDSALKLNGMVTLDEVAALIWKGIEAGKEKEEILQQILEEYDVDEETARTDMDDFLKRFSETGIITI